MGLSGVEKANDDDDDDDDEDDYDYERRRSKVSKHESQAIRPHGVSHFLAVLATTRPTMITGIQIM